jgi:hypothetical protein
VTILSNPLVPLISCLKIIAFLNMAGAEIVLIIAMQNLNGVYNAALPSVTPLFNPIANLTS